MKKLLWMLGGALAAGLLAGCAGNVVESTTGTHGTLAIPGPKLQGRVHGGQAPVVGVQVQLYAAGSTGYGSAFPYTSGTSLLGSNAVTTDASGNFAITGDYTCPSAATQVYLVGTGGNPVPGQGANPNLAMMVALGPCGNLGPNTYIAVNELTTVASVWALAPFMSGITNVGTSPGNVTGLANAFATVNTLVDTRDAVIPGPALPAGSVLPVAEINTLADILESCIDTTGGTAGDNSGCGNLFALAKNAQGVAPTDTITAALNIAQNTGANVSQLNLLPTLRPPYQPTLGSAAPPAWTLAIQHTGSGTLSSPAGVAVDGAGNVWIANGTGGNVVELGPSGAVLSGAGYAAGQAGNGAIAVDANGNAYASAAANGSLLKISPSGAVSTLSGGGLGVTNSIAVDGTGQIWAAEASGVLSGFSASGTALAAGGFTGGGVSGPVSLAATH